MAPIGGGVLLCLGFPRPHLPPFYPLPRLDLRATSAHPASGDVASGTSTAHQVPIAKIIRAPNKSLVQPSTRRQIFPYPHVASIAVILDPATRCCPYGSYSGAHVFFELRYFLNQVFFLRSPQTWCCGPVPSSRVRWRTDPGIRTHLIVSLIHFFPANKCPRAVNPSPASSVVTLGSLILLGHNRRSGHD